jgi:hypothetical protein
MPSARASVVLASLTVILAAAPCAAEWHRLDSPNFTLVGDVGARELHDLAVKFEGFRETLGRAISARATTSAVPTIIIVFPTDKAFSPFKPTYQGKPRAVAGFFAAGANVNYILMQSGGAGVDRIIFHEYAHLIVSNVMSNAPVWLNEGLAEFYSTFRLMDDGRRAQLGLAVGEHLQLLKSTGHVPLPQLLEVDPGSPLYNEEARASVFYAESWALTHMILNGQPSRVAELSAYLRSVADGVPEARAWEETFGTARTEQEFQQYLARDLYNTAVIDFPEKVATVSAAATSLSPADAAAFIAAFLVQHRQYDAAAAQLQQAFKSDPVNPLATIALAQLDIGRQQYVSAEKRLVGLGKSGDWLVAYHAAMAMADLAGIGVAGSPNVDLIQAARLQLDIVQRDRGELPNALAHRAALELTNVDAPGVEAAASIARARVLTPGRYDYAFIQAQILTRRGEFAEARDVVGPLMTGAYPAGVRDSARSLMGFVVESEARRRAGARADASNRPATSGSRSVPVPGFESQPRRQDDGRPKFVPDFRQLRAGEQRFEATLERIDCAPGSPAVFRVIEPDAPERLAAARLGDVDFISYRDDVRGGVNCGVLADAMRVFITWREGDSTQRDKTVVAVEFLPKN